MGQIEIGISDSRPPRTMRLDLDPSYPNELTLLNCIGNGQFYELDISQVLLRVLAEGDAVIDVGANAGFFTILAGTLVGPTGRVLSLEPDPANCARLRNNVAINGYDHVTVVDRPAIDVAGPVEFFINSDDSGGNALWDPGQFPGNVRSSANRRVLPLAGTTIDDEIARLNISRVRLVKIDTEGADHLVLKGARNLLSSERPPLVLCELHEFGMARMATSQAAMRDYMAGFGYESFMIYYDGSLPHLVPRGTRIQSQFICNILFSSMWELDRYWPSYFHQPGKL